MTKTVELVADYGCHTGESPVWNPIEDSLYWIDIPQGRLLRYEPASGLHQEVSRGGVIGGLCCCADGALLLLRDHGRVERWRSGTASVVVDHAPELIGTRFNDGAADRAGRVFTGAMPTQDRTSSIYCLETDGNMRELYGSLGLSNGPAFTSEGVVAYWADTEAGVIYRLDWIEEPPYLVNMRLFSSEGPGMPDGLCLDEEGCLWSARWEGGCVLRLSPEGVELERIEIPVSRVTSVAFGRRALDRLYITTAGGDDKDGNGALAGALFAAEPGVRGVPAFPARINAPPDAV